MSGNRDIIQAQYEAYPYPTRNPADEAKRLIEGSPSALLEIQHYLHDGALPAGPLRLLSAGGGTGDAAIMMAQQAKDMGLDAEIVHLDLSAASQNIARERAMARNLDITFVQDSLLNAPRYGPFDYIDCCGVLHHLDNPPAGLAALKAALKPGRGMGIMVYAPYGRLGVYPLQSALRRLTGSLAPADKVALGKRIYQALPPHHHFRMNSILNDHKVSDAGFYDLLLHSTDRAYTVTELAEFAATAGLKIVSFVEKVKYDPATYIDSKLLTTSPADKIARAALAEELSTNIFKHIVYLAERDDCEATNSPEMIPIYHNFEGQLIARKMKPGDPVTGMLQGLQTLLFMPRLAPAIMQRIDGVRSWRAIHADLEEKLGGDAPSWEKFWEQASDVWHKLHSINVLLLKKGTT